MRVKGQKYRFASHLICNLFYPFNYFKMAQMNPIKSSRSDNGNLNASKLLYISVYFQYENKIVTQVN